MQILTVTKNTIIALTLLAVALPAAAATPPPHAGLIDPATGFTYANTVPVTQSAAVKKIAVKKHVVKKHVVKKASVKKAVKKSKKHKATASTTAPVL